MRHSSKLACTIRCHGQLGHARSVIPPSPGTIRSPQRALVRYLGPRLHGVVAGSRSQHLPALSWRRSHHALPHEPKQHRRLPSADRGTDHGPGAIPEQPAAGRFFWFLVTAENAWGEGTAGNATSGPRQLTGTSACSGSCLQTGATCASASACCSGVCSGSVCLTSCCGNPGASCTPGGGDCCMGGSSCRSNGVCCLTRFPPAARRTTSAATATARRGAAACPTGLTAPTASVAATGAGWTTAGSLADRQDPRAVARSVLQRRLHGGPLHLIRGREPGPAPSSLPAAVLPRQHFGPRWERAGPLPSAQALHRGA